MSEVTQPSRADMLRVLAEKGMGWKFGFDFTIELDGGIRDHFHRDWAPFDDGRAAWELWRAMRNQPGGMYNPFRSRLLFMMWDRWPFELEPHHIAQAAYEALKEDHDAG